MQYVDEIKNLRNIILNDISTETGQNQPLQLATPTGTSNNTSAPSGNRENILKKALKCK